MTTNVNIHNSLGHNKIKVVRVYGDGSEFDLGEILPGELTLRHDLSVWEGCKLIITEVPDSPATA